MAKTDFTSNINNVIASLTALDGTLGKVSSKLAEFGRESKGTLEKVNMSLGTENIAASEKELQTVLNNILEIKRTLLTRAGEVLRTEDLKTTNGELNLIINKLAVMRDSLQALSIIQKSGDKLGVQVYPFTAENLKTYNPRLTREEHTDKISTYGSYNTNTNRLGIGAISGPLGPLETALHELAHHIQNIVEKSGVDTAPIIQANASRATALAPIVTEKFKSAGLPEGLAREAAQSQINGMMNDIWEAFAIEFSNLALTGKTAWPEFGNAINEMLGSLGDETTKEILALKDKLIANYTDQVMKDLDAGLPEKGIEMRMSPLISRLPKDATKSIENKLYTYRSPFEGRTLASESPDIQDQNNVKQLGQQAEETKKKIHDLDNELRNMLEDATRGKLNPAGVTNPARGQELINKLVAGEDIGVRPRVGKGQYLTMDKEKRAAIQQKANDIAEQIRILNEVEEAIGKAATVTVEPTKTGAAKQDVSVLEKQVVESKKKISDLKNTLDKLTKDMLEAVSAGKSVGGGGGLTVDLKKVEEIANLSNQIRKEIENLNKIQEAINEVARTKTQGGAASGVLVDVAHAGAEEVRARDIIGSNKEPRDIKEAAFQGKAEVLFGKYGFNKEQIDQAKQTLTPLVDIYENLNLVLSSLTAKYEILDNGVTKFTISARDNEGVVQKVNAYLTQQGQILSELDYNKTKAPLDVGNVVKEAFPGLNGEQIGKINEATKAQQEVFSRLGTTLEKVGVSYTVLEDGTIRFNLAMSDSAGTVAKTNVYMDQQGIILDELSQKTKVEAKAASDAAVSMEKLEAALQKAAEARGQGGAGMGPQRASRAMALAGKSGFTPDDLKQVYTQQPAGVSFLKFEKLDEATGVVQKLEVTVDRFGQVMTRTNRRLLGFFDSVVKNTGELLKWSLGVGLVYGSYYRLQQMVQLAIDNQSKLADVTVTLGDANRDLRDILNDVSVVAIATGESINDVLETYTMAYRAVGGMEDPVKRTASANRLLYDSTILNKLSSLDASSAIDVLAGSLRQLQKPGEDVGKAFERGTELLDRWVVVSRRANVDLATLATAFSITSETAENSGMSIEELNAVIASLAEKIGGLGGRETGNAVRALIGGVYQQQAAETLGKYGIAVTDVEGKMRNFLDISKDIYSLYSQGIISEDQLNKIGYVLGGGVRRGQQYVAFLTDLPRIMEIVADQSDSAGSAQDALGRKMDTVKTSITNMGNATQRLAFTLGSEGGVLGATNAIVMALTGLANILDVVVGKMGKIAIPAALAAILAMYFSGDIGKSKLGSLQSGLSMRMGGLATSMLGYLPGMRNLEGSGVGSAGAAATGLSMQGQQRAERLGTSFGQWAGPNTLRYGGAIAVGALPALSRAGEGDVSGAGVVFAGSVIGALVTGGSPIGAVIGSSLAEAAVQGFRNAKGELEDIFVLSVKPGETPKDKAAEKGITKETPAETANRLLEQMQSSTAAAFDAMVWNLIKRVPKELTGTVKPGEMTDIQANVLLAKQITSSYENLGERSGYTKELYDQAKAALKAIEDAEKYRVTEIPLEETRIYAQQAKIGGTSGIYRDFLDEIAKGQRGELRTSINKGEIKPKEYREKLDYTYALPAAASNLYTSLYKDQANFNKATAEGKKELEMLSETLLFASQESRDYLTQISTEIFDINKLMQELRGSGPEAFKMMNGQAYTLAQLMELDKEKTQELSDTIQGLNKQNMIDMAKSQRIPSVVDFKGRTMEEMKMIEAEAKKIQEARYKAFESSGELPEGTFDTLVTVAEPIFAYLGDLLPYYLAKGILDSSDLQAAMEKLLAEGKIKEQKIGYQFMGDVTQAQMASIEPQYQAMRSQIVAAGGTSEEEQLLTYFKDSSSPSLMTKDWKLVQYLLQKILDVNEKQLDGLYNLPSEATFYVPSQTLQLAYQAGVNSVTGGGAGGKGSMVSPGSTVTTETIALADSLNAAKLAVSEARAQEDKSKPRPLVPVDRMEEGTKFWAKNKDDIKEAFTPLSDVLRGNYEPPKLSKSEELLQAILEAIRQINSPEKGSMSDGAKQIVEGFKGMLDILKIIIPTPKVPGVGAGVGVGVGVPSATVPENLQGILSNSAASQKAVSTNLKLDMTSSVQLMVDGRTLASIVKQYLWEDLIRFDSTAGTSTRALMI